MRVALPKRGENEVYIRIPDEMDRALLLASADAGAASPTEWLRDSVLPPLLEPHHKGPLGTRDDWRPAMRKAAAAAGESRMATWLRKVVLPPLLAHYDSQSGSPA